MLAQSSESRPSAALSQQPCFPPAPAAEGGTQEGESPKPTTAAPPPHTKERKHPPHGTCFLCTLAVENRSSDSLAPF